MKKRGFAIILVLATLVLLAMLSLTYIKLALIDRNIARNYMDNKRARLIAQSGVEYAIARVQEDLSDTSWSWQEAKTITINGSNTKYTESTGSTYGQDRDIFKVTVRDSNSMINVNDGLGNDRVTTNTKRILNVLGDVKGIANLGNKIIDNRPVQGYQSKQELLKFITQDEFNTIKNLVTIYAWQDPNVANPVPLSSNVISAYTTPYNKSLATALGTIDVYRYGRGYEAYYDTLITAPMLFSPDFAIGDTLGHAIYALDELNPQWIEIVSRSPVNINTASQAVLITLLRDLRGLFVSDRRANSPCHKQSYDLYRGSPGTTFDNLTKYTFDYSPANPKGDELGFLYATKEIDLSLAINLALEIKNCRDKIGIYATKWFGGQFKTWRQFNAFCDEHVGDSKLLNDTRTIFYEYDLNPGSDPYNTPVTYNTPVLSEVARKQAGQAIADVLKANFNPNLHLNEINPDANIKTLVDKTDLIINSTEFCFTPMGYFEIESEGFVLKPNDADNNIIAKSNIEAVVKLFDAYRETNQKQFLNHINSITDYNNFIGQDSTPVSTNNARTIQVGPEPEHILDTGYRIAKENEYSGYIKLPTLNGDEVVGSTSPPATTTTSEPTTTTEEIAGSTDTSTQIVDQFEFQGKTYTTKQTITTTTEPGTRTTTTTVDTSKTTVTSTLGARLYAHFRENFNLDYHADGDTYKSASSTLKDKTELVGGPYTYDLFKRLARSFRKESNINTLRTSCDFRIDGAYLERNGGLTYRFNGASTNVFKNPGLLSYWIKPSFYPEATGKPRAFFSLSRSSYTGDLVGFYMDRSKIFANYFFPSHWPASATDENFKIDYTGFDSTAFAYRSTSLTFGYSRYKDFWARGAIGFTTPFLNHLSHPTCGTKPNYMRSGQWLHVVCVWNMPTTSTIDTTTDNYCQIWINGGKPANSAPVYASPPVPISISDHLTSSMFSIGYSDPSATGIAALGSSRDDLRPWSSDSTIDEFYIILPSGNTTTTETTTTTEITYTGATTTTRNVVTEEVTDKQGNLISSTVISDTTTTSTPSPSKTKTTSTTSTNSYDLTGARNLATSVYKNSRYYKPSGQDSYFISSALNLPLRSKTTPQESILPDPSGTAGTATSFSDNPIKIIGASWTWYGETVDTSGKVVLKNYRDYATSAALKIEETTSTDPNLVCFPELAVKLIIKEGTNPPAELPTEYKDDGFSKVENVELSAIDELKYKVIFRINSNPSVFPDNTTLLYTPVLDDVTIYFKQNPGFLVYSIAD